MPEGQPFSFPWQKARDPFKPMVEKDTVADCCNTWATSLSPSGPQYLHLDQWLDAPSPGHLMYLRCSWIVTTGRGGGMLLEPRGKKPERLLNRLQSAGWRLPAKSDPAPNASRAEGLKP